MIGEKYANHETLGKLTIRKTGEVLTGWQSEPGGIDPCMTGEAESGNFTYETRPLAGAEVHHHGQPRTSTRRIAS